MKYTESDTKELKRELTDAVKEVIISFLNTKGGTIYVGINDDGTLNSSFLKEKRHLNQVISISLFHCRI